MGFPGLLQGKLHLFTLLQLSYGFHGDLNKIGFLCRVVSQLKKAVVRFWSKQILKACEDGVYNASFDVGPVALFILENCNSPLVLFWHLRIARRPADALRSFPNLLYRRVAVMTVVLSYCSIRAYTKCGYHGNRGAGAGKPGA
jgi:hypothetical protein